MPIDDPSHDDTEDRAFAWSRSLVASQPSVDGGGLADALRRVCLAVPAGLGLSGAAVILSSGDDTEALSAASDPASAASAELELSLGEGPSRDALRAGRPVLVDDLGDAARAPWVAYATAIAARGVCSVFAFPLHVGAARFGTLTMYGPEARPLGRTRTSRCLALAELATDALLSGSTDHLEGRAPSLDGNVDLRNEIYQAQGMAMVTLGTDLATALAHMRAHAFRHDRTLLEVSLDIVAGRLMLTEERTDT